MKEGTMSYKINTTNQPVDDKGDSPFIEVEASEFIDLQRMGLVRKGKGDVGDDGELVKKAAKDAPDEVINARPASTFTGQTPTIEGAQ